MVSGAYHEEVSVSPACTVIIAVVGLPEVLAGESVEERLVGRLLVDVEEHVVAFVHLLFLHLQHPRT